MAGRSWVERGGGDVGADIRINGVAAGNFEFDISSDNDDISIFLYIINTL
jgi:hypothetical protein